ncbi:hypothetical protein D3C71_1365510 [compost metagenome]
MSDEDRIREDAYPRWEAEGRPEGQQERIGGRRAKRSRTLAFHKPGRRTMVAVSGRPRAHPTSRRMMVSSLRT